MIFKAIKYGVVSLAGLALVGGVVFGTDLFSYVSSSSRAMRTAVKDNVPVEFQLRRARDLVDDLVPEMQANVRVIATQEVEIAGLRRDIEQSRANLQAERTRVQKLRESLSSENGDYTFSGIHYSREQVKDDLAHRFDFLKEAEVVQSGKERLLQNRERSLAAAMQTLDHMKSQKTLLEGQIASLEAQNQLVQSAAVGSNLTVDNTKLAQTERLINDVKKQLDIAERVLAHETRFVQPIQVDSVNEKDLLSQVDEHLAAHPTDAATKPAAAGEATASAKQP
jgi:hypothetical protein